MNWYKKSQISLETFEDRNLLNDKIKHLKEIGEKLSELSKIVFQDAKVAKSMNFELANNNKVGNHPNLQNALLEADLLALDSPWRFSDICLAAADMVDGEIRRLERERRQFAKETMPNRMKGWVAND